jgi:hypothetical protein
MAKHVPYWPEQVVAALADNTPANTASPASAPSHVHRRHPLPSRAGFEIERGVFYSVRSNSIAGLEVRGIRIDGWHGRSSRIGGMAVPPGLPR